MTFGLALGDGDVVRTVPRAAYSPARGSGVRRTPPDQRQLFLPVAADATGRLVDALSVV